MHGEVALSSLVQDFDILQMCLLVSDFGSGCAIRVSYAETLRDRQFQGRRRDCDLRDKSMVYNVWARPSSRTETYEAFETIQSSTSSQIASLFFSMNIICPFPWIPTFPNSTCFAHSQPACFRYAAVQ